MKLVILEQSKEQELKTVKMVTFSPSFQNENIDISYI